MMRSEWILDVLSDLKNYALSSDLPQLAEHLDDAALVALTEIASQEERLQGQNNNGAKISTGIYPGGVGAS